MGFEHKRRAAQHYFQIYREYEQIYSKFVVLYELGGFYEMFGVDNKREKIGNISQVTRDLGIRETRCSKKILENSQSNPQQAGFPSHSLPTYIEKLVNCGYVVVIFSQSDGGPRGKKIRKLDRIISKGTYVDTNIAKEETKNAIMVFIEEQLGDVLDIAISTIDVTTGKTFCYPVIGKTADCLYNAGKIIHTSSPVEVVIMGKAGINLDEYRSWLDIDKDILTHLKHVTDKVLFTQSYQDQFLKKVFPDSGTISIVEFLDLEHYPNLIVSFVSLLKFIYDSDESILEKIYKPVIQDPTGQVKLSHRTIIQLNLTESKEGKSLFEILNKASTPMGKRLLKSRLVSPIRNCKKLEKRYQEVSNFMEEDLYKKVEEHLDKIYDLERFHRLIALKKLNPCELLLLEKSYVSVWRIYCLLRKTSKKMSDIYFNREVMKSLKKMVGYYRDVVILKEASKYNLDSIETRIFKKGLYSDIDKEYDRVVQSELELRQYKDVLSSVLMDLGDSKKDIKISKTVTEGYYFMTNEKKAKILKENAEEKLELKRQKTGTKIFSKTIKSISRRIIDAKLKLSVLSKKRFIEVLEHMSDVYNDTMKTVADSVARVDVVKSIAKISKRNKYCRPVISNDYGKVSYFRTTNMRHPIVEHINQTEPFVPLNINLGGESESGLLLYGVNGIGKSLCLKSVAISIIMAQSGFFVPSDSFIFYPFSHIITKISMTDNIYKKRSFFECEMIEMGKMLEKACENIIILADELCSGTETNGAISLVGSAIDYLSKKNANFMFTTHLHQLTKIPHVKDLLNSKVKCLHLTMKVEDGKIIFTREFSEGQGLENYGIEIARQLGVGDSTFIRNAIAIRRVLDPEIDNEILTTKQSNYNKDLYMEKCEKCGSKKGLHTHHKREQKEADEYGMIGTMHKNNRSNLQVLCKKCHRKHHSRKSDD